MTSAVSEARLDAEYVLPLRWSSDEGLPELTQYLRRLSDWIDVTVVDGSDPAPFAAHAESWRGLVRHLPVDAPPALNGKARGVITGVRAARHERVVLADDDVRYDYAGLRAMLDALDDADAVRPQNHFRPAPWHARWDTGRSLLNRVCGGDFPGTLGLRRTAFLRAGGYDADVLFENLELLRTLRAHGGVLKDLPGLYVARRPPSARHFLSQRVRQAYDSQAQPVRLVVELAVLPLTIAAARRPPLLLAAVSAVVAAAEVGRRRAGGATVFPRTAALWAPLWLLERGVMSWLALGARARGGVRYAGTRMPRAGTSRRELRRRAAAALHDRPAGEPAP